MPNQTDPSSNQVATPVAPAGMPMHTDLPPLPDSMTQASPPTPLPPIPAPTTTLPPSTPAGGSTGSGSPPDMPSIVSTPKKKFGGGKIIATILGLFLLVGGLGAGLLLTQQQQLFKQQASGPKYVGPVPDTILSDPMAGAAKGEVRNVEGCVVEQVVNGTYKPLGRLAGCGSTGSGGGGGPFNCQAYGKNSNGFITYLVKNSNDTATVKWVLEYGVQSNDWKLIWGTNYNMIITNTGNHNTCNGNGLNGCAYINAGLGTFTTPVLDQNTKYYFKLEAQDPGKNGKNGGPGEDPAWCGNGTLLFIGPPVITPTPTPTGTPVPTPTATPGPVPFCSSVSAYDSSWNPIAQGDLPNLTAGSSVNFCVSGVASSGTFDKAQFMVSGVVEPETTAKRPGTNDFCQSVGITAATTTVNVKAKIHHATLGWFGESF